MASLSHHDIPFVNIVYQVELLGVSKGKDQLDESDRMRIQQAARSLAAHNPPGSLVCLDIECWHLFDVSPQQLEESATKYLTVLQWFKSAAPSLKVGYYGVVPVADYKLRRNNPQRVASWYEENRAVARIGEAADIICPSLYTYTDPAEWEWEAKTSIRYAQRFHKPVLPFVWPQREVTGYPFMDGQTWLRELQVLDRLGADGVIIWGLQGFEVDERSDWWQKTLMYLNSQDRSVGPQREDRK